MIQVPIIFFATDDVPNIGIWWLLTMRVSIQVLALTTIGRNSLSDWQVSIPACLLWPICHFISSKKKKKLWPRLLGYLSSSVENQFILRNQYQKIWNSVLNTIPYVANRSTLEILSSPPAGHESTWPKKRGFLVFGALNRKSLLRTKVSRATKNPNRVSKCFPADRYLSDRRCALLCTTQLSLSLRRNLYIGLWLPSKFLEVFCFNMFCLGIKWGPLTIHLLSSKALPMEVES